MGLSESWCVRRRLRLLVETFLSAPSFHRNTEHCPRPSTLEQVTASAVPMKRKFTTPEQVEHLGERLCCYIVCSYFSCPCFCFCVWESARMLLDPSRPPGPVESACVIFFFCIRSSFFVVITTVLPKSLCPRVSFPIFFVSYSEKILSAPFRRAYKQKSRVPSFPRSSASHTSPPQPDLCRPGPRAHWPFVLSPRPLPERSVPSCAPVLVPGACCIFRSEPARALSLPRKPRSSLLTSLLPSWSGCAHTPLRLVI